MMKLTSVKVLSLLFGLGLMFGLFLVGQLNSVMLKSSESSNAIINLKLLNKEIAFDFKDNLFNINYDRTYKTLDEFQKNLDVLRQLQGSSIISNIYSKGLNISKVEEIFEQKRRLIDYFNFISSGAITFLIESEYKTKNMKGIDDIKDLLLRIRGTNFLDKDAIASVEEELAKLALKYSKQGSEAYALLQKSAYVVRAYTQMQQTYYENMQLNLKDVLDDLSKNYEDKYDDIISFLQRVSVLTIFIFICLLAFIIYQSKKSLADKKEIAQLRLALDNDFSSIIFTDNNNLITYVNKSFEYTTGYKFEDIVGKSPSFLKSYAHSNSFYEEIGEYVKNRKEWCTQEIVSKSADDKFIYERANFIPFDFDGESAGYIGIKLNRTSENVMLNELKIKNNQIKTQSITDKLTGFGNYFAMTERLDANDYGTIICITIKNFVNLNFFYQTKIIEAILKSFASTLKLYVDTYNIRAELFRFQDDSFYIWYSGQSLEADIAHIRDYFNFSSLKITVDGKEDTFPGLKILIGVSLSNDTPQTSRLMQSVLANQEAANTGLGIYYYKENDAIEGKYYNNQSVTQLIEYALENDTVIVECQGIFNIEEDEKEAKIYEVLVRLIDQNGKIRYPGEFLDIAVKAQLYTQITKKVIERAFSLVEHYTDYTFSVNLSSLDMSDISVRELLETKLANCSSPERVIFEMLESADINDYDLVNSFIKRIKSYGSKISIDDFGSGYSNYYRILELDIDNIKIDGSIIKKLPTDQNARDMVDMITRFAAKKNYKIVAEFVSSPEILEQVKHFGIRYGQGFLLGKPKSMDIL
ncbi:EAL domain-containing protein [Campylobacter sp. 19-13652]|uniref:EAL domain-containing protein n=1 Tax=Campylobacter sp. 19-13652 TaxID=2840180 RepID=UPI001C78099D|nr:EAL domain-containing protein [Campylobacter sp. 19-13652]BCX78850.1 hypothetical protein LBC_03120 [Campylobacter sp. 19-13652]